MAKKVNVQEEMVNEMIVSIEQVIGGTIDRVAIGEMVHALIEATEVKMDDSRIYSLIADRCKLGKTDLKIEQIYTIVKINPLTKTHFPFKDSKLESLRLKLEEEK